MKKSISKISSLILSLALIISALTVPSVLGTAATSEETVADKTGSYEFNFNGETDLAKAYAYKKDYLPEISTDVDKNVLEMNSGSGKVFARLPFKLEAGKKYNYSISYRVVTKNDPDSNKSTVLKLISSGENDTINSIVTAGTARNLSVLLSWAELKVNSDYTTLSGSFEATASNVTDAYQFLTIHYETNKNFEQVLYIDKISIYEALDDVTGNYTFDFENPSELARAYSYNTKNSLPEIIKDGEKNVLKMNSTDGKVFARLPFKLEAGKKYNYSISYRVVTKNDPDSNKSTVLKLISSGENDTINSIVTAGTARNLSVLLSWAELKVNSDYTTLSGSFEATASNVTDAYQFLTIHYETNKNFEQVLYIDKISIYEALDDVTGNYTFDFENPSELQAKFSWKNDDYPAITEDNGKQVISMTSLNSSESHIQLPYVLKADKRYYYSINYRVISQSNINNTAVSTVLQLNSAAKKTGGGHTANHMITGNLLVSAYSWKPLDISETYETVDGTFTTDNGKVTEENKYLSLLYKTNAASNQVIYIDSITIRECNSKITLVVDNDTTDTISNLGIGDVVALPLPEKEGYYFDGWYTDSEYTNSIGLTYAVTKDGEVTLYGKWELKETPDAPAAPRMASHTQYSVTLEETAGYEYSIDDGKTWQLSPEFSGLFTGVYNFTQRVAATKTTNASPASDAFTYTIAAYGDANADGEINGLDLAEIKSALLNSEEKQAEDGFNANGDNAFDIRDLVCAKKIIAAQAGTTAKTQINNVDITGFAFVNNITSEIGTAIATAFTDAVKGRTDSNFAAESEKTIEISLDTTLDDESYKIYVAENGNMYITAKAEDILEKAVNALCDRIANYGKDKTLNLQGGYTFSGSYPTVKYIAFTFDDGPTANTVDGAPIKTFVDTLSSYGGAGTLFVIGGNIEKKGTKQLEYALENGFEIGNHTMNHTNFNYTNADETTIRSEITGVNNLLKENLGYTARWLRPGELAVNKTVYKVAKELNMPIIGSVKNDANDYDDNSTSASIKENVINKASDGQIVLLHADKQKTADCFEEIASTLYKKGYRFVTVSELLSIRGTGVIPTDIRISGIKDSVYQKN